MSRSCWFRSKARATGRLIGALVALRGQSGGPVLPVCIAAVCLVSCALFLKAQEESSRITFYSSQTAYSLPLLDRNNVQYVGLLESLEPLGSVSARIDGSRWRLKFTDIEAQFENGKKRVKIAGKTVELTAPFLLENRRGFVPVGSLQRLLPLFVKTPVQVHEAAARVLVGKSPVRFTVKKLGNSKIAFEFSAPVNPTIATEPGKLSMTFARDPVVGDTAPVPLNGSTTSAVFSEADGTAVISVNTGVPLLATFSNDRRTITLAPVGPTVAESTPARAPVATQAQTVQPAPRSRPIVIVDAAHGGEDPGATLSGSLVEKTVTLAMARALRRELESRGIATMLLRDGDNTLTPDQRSAIADMSGTALYVALHASNSASGVHLYTAMMAATSRQPLSFVPVATAQASYVESSRALTSIVSTELLKRDVQVISLPAAIPGLNSIAEPALVIEVAPRANGSVDDLNSPSYQQTMAAALANSIAAARGRLQQAGQ